MSEPLSPWRWVRRALAIGVLLVAEGATERFVEVFATEADLRAAHDLGKVAGIPLGFLVFCAVLVVLFRRWGAESVG